MSRTGSGDTPFLFNGRYGVQTESDGLLYMRTRYYNPVICRFLNADPTGFWGGINLYAYGHGNPVSETDPFGLCAQIADFDERGMAYERAIARLHTLIDYDNTLINNLASELLQEAGDEAPSATQTADSILSASTENSSFAAIYNSSPSAVLLDTSSDVVNIIGVPLTFLAEVKAGGEGDYSLVGSYFVEGMTAGVAASRIPVWSNAAQTALAISAGANYVDEQWSNASTQIVLCNELAKAYDDKHKYLAMLRAFREAQKNNAKVLAPAN